MKTPRYSNEERAALIRQASPVFARAGERVTDADGNTVCTVKRDLKRHTNTRAADFEDWRVAVPKKGEPLDATPGFRTWKKPSSGMLYPQVCIEGEWRPVPLPTPSMDDKSTPSAPRRDVAQYEADRAAGINPFGRPEDARSIKEDKP